MLKLIKVLPILFVLASCAGLTEVGTGVIVITKEGVNSTVDKKESIKTGEACSLNILGLVATGDASVETAKYNGGIKTITSIDRDVKALNFYISLGKSCTIVKGY